MDNPRPEKIAVVDEVRKRFDDSEAALLTEYRGVNVADMAALRRALTAAGGDYKVYKNTLVRFAAADLELEIGDLLTGPTAIAFVPTDGTGDPVAVAKVLKDFAKGNPNLIIKGGVLGKQVLSEDETKALAEIAPREELLAKLAGLMAAPLQQFASLLNAVPQNFAYGLAALIEQQGGAPEAPSEEPAADEAPADEAPAEEASSDDAAAEEAPAEAASSETPAEPVAEAPAADDSPSETDEAPAAAVAEETAADDAAETAAEAATEES